MRDHYSYHKVLTREYQCGGLGVVGHGIGKGGSVGTVGLEVGGHAPLQQVQVQSQKLHGQLPPDPGPLRLPPSAGE
jgi:hypothetical protein